MNRFKKLVFFLAVFQFQEVYALSYEVKNSENFTADEITSAEFLFEKTLELMPEKIKNDLNLRLSVEFIDTQEKEIVISCDSSTFSKATKFLGATEKIFSNQKIKLNKAFLNYMNEEKASTVEYNCKHKNVYFEAIATLLHETLHAYENNLHNNKLSIPSSSKAFNGHIFNLKNKLVEKSPDSYEFTNSSESFAVNFEYFIIDQEFKCRKPSLYKYYSSLLGHYPFEDYDCSSINAFKSGTNARLVRIDKDRLYRIDYLLAGPGDDMVSRFGHSMIRLVMCRPGRELGPDCLKDISSHLVLTFRANTGNGSTSYIKGINGTYPSQLFAIPFTKVLDEYNRDEFRDIYSYPLKLSNIQKDLFLEKALESHWAYSGKYYYISNNCAVETSDLIKSVLGEQHPLRSFSPQMPNTLRDALISSKLIEEFSSSDIANVGTLYFPTTFKKDLDKAMANIKSLIPSNLKSYLDYTKKTTSAERLNWFKSSKNEKGIQMSFFLLENVINKEFNKKITKSLVNVFKSKKTSAEDLAILQKHVSVESDLSPWRITVKNTYGLPLQDEVDESVGLRLLDDFNRSNLKVLDVLRKYDPELSSDFEQNQANLKEFFNLKKK